MCVDFLVSGEDVVPEFRQKEKLVGDYVLEMGGSNCIFACQAAKLGLEVTALGKVGNDVFGQLILEKLKKSGVNTEHVIVDPDEKTGVGIQLCKKDDRAILTYSGTIDALTIDDIPELLLNKCRHLHVGSYFLMNRIRPYIGEIMKRVKQAGSTVSLDTNWDPEEEWDGGLKDLFPYVDVFLPNENELLAISGEDYVNTALEKLGERIGIVVVKMGEKGAIGFSKGKKVYCSSLKVDYVDSVGAGDSFDAGFIYGYLNGLSLEECLKIACICGAFNTTARGGIKGQIDIKKLNEILENERSVLDVRIL